MNAVFTDASTHVLRFDIGEEVLTTLKQYCTDNKIHGATISAIGAAKDLELSWYDIDEKRYSDKHLTGKYEITNLTGNVALLDDEVSVHIHGTFSDEHMQAFGGHVKSVTVGVTCEMSLSILKGKMLKTKDGRTGLNLLCPIK